MVILGNKTSITALDPERDGHCGWKALAYIPGFDTAAAARLFL